MRFVENVFVLNQFYDILVKLWWLLIITSYDFEGNEIRKYIINGIIENGHFLINVLSMKRSFPVKFTNRLINQINIRFSIMPHFTFIGRWVVNF